MKIDDADDARLVNRRTTLKLVAGAAAAWIASPAGRLLGAQADEAFIDVRRVPDSVAVVTETGTVDAVRRGDDRWDAGGVIVRTQRRGDVLQITLASAGEAVKHVHLRWSGS